MSGRVLVVGDGIEGLACALCARESGFDVTIVGTSATTDEHALVELAPSAVKVLRALGLRTALHNIATLTQTHQLRSWRSSYLIALLPLGGVTQERYGAPHYHVSAADLRRLLLGKLDAQTEYRPQHRLLELRHLETGIEVDLGQAVTATTEQAVSSERFAALIAADGSASPARKLLFGPQDVGRVGKWQWRAVTTATELPALFRNPHQLTTWLGPGASIRHGADNQHVFVSALVPADHASVVEPVADGGAPASMYIDPFAAWNVALQPLVAQSANTASNTNALPPTPVLSYPEINQWSRGAATLTGSAAHPLSGSISSEIPLTLALEDAWVLGRMLEYHEDELDKAFSEFQRFRQPRARQASAYVTKTQQEYQLNDGAAAWRRNFRHALATRFLPDIAIAKFDWLYGYEAIRGFE